MTGPFLNNEKRCPLKILIIKPSSLGDVIHAMPVVSAIRTLAPSSEIHWLVNASLSGLVEMTEGVSRIYPFERQLWKNKQKITMNIRKLYQLAKALRREKYDVVLDLQGLFRSGFLSWLTGVRRRIGFDNAREGAVFFYSEKIPVKGKALHALDANLESLKNLFPGKMLPPVSFKMKFPPSVLAAIKEKGFDVLLSKGSYCVFSPQARWTSKTWPREHYLHLAVKMTDASRLKIIITGNGEDKDFWEKASASHPDRIISLMDKTTLPELAWIISGCEFMVCNDSGPMHLAGAFHKKVIALMGPTKPEKTGPYWNACILREPVSCSPCLKRECPKGEKGMECMRHITPEKVFRILEKEGLLK